MFIGLLGQPAKAGLSIMQLNCGTSQTLVLITEEMLVMEYKERESMWLAKHMSWVSFMFTAYLQVKEYAHPFGISTSNKQMCKKSTWIPEI